MRIFRSLAAIPPSKPPLAAAIGNFDGLHLGHRRIIDRLKAAAARRGLPAAAVTFAPHPEKVFGPHRLCMLQTLDQRLEGLANLGLDAVVIVPFSLEFARRPGEEFVRETLISGINARVVVVGADFRFGPDRSAAVADLRRWGRRDGLAVRTIPHVKRAGRIVRSSRIRDLLMSGRIEMANALLGRPYAVEGDVVAGARRGRRIGFPTANLITPNELIPRGVFVSVLTSDERVFPSVTSVGVRPTFHGHEVTIETHILDFHGDLYGVGVRLAFLSKLRDEARYPDAESLRAQIARDAEAARGYFRRRVLGQGI
ncbi:MAG: riboflavin biosynthesis protein RibF [Candidatus Aminicenantes bacterium]|nr:riboflavin biosynthesis protein RibF [Candidatus Aminicenantes bacterium]